MTEAAIAERGLIGDLQDLQKAALVSTDGSIDPPAPPQRTMARTRPRGPCRFGPERRRRPPGRRTRHDPPPRGQPIGPDEKTIALLAGDPGVLNLVVLPGRARNPDGDAIECDVLGGTANTVLPSLRRLQVGQRGSIVIEPVELAISGRVADVETQQLGALANAPVWEAVEARIRADGTYSPSFYLFLIIAGIIGAVGILTNSQILIVAAMVLGPEYGAITSIALGLDRHFGKAVREGMSALTVGFLLAIVAAFAFALLVRVLGLEPTAFRLGIRPVTNLIDTPNLYSLVVAVLAGIVGIVSLTHARTSTLVGVFISVTTIPAASDIGVASAFGSWSEARGSLLQLLLNVVVLIVVGLLTLRFVRLLWRRISERRSRDR